jgi:hypothetical protein
VAPAFSLRFRFRHIWHNGGRDVGSLALQQPFAGLLTALLGLPMRGVFGIARQNQLGLLAHRFIPPPHNDDLPPSLLLSMDDDAPSVMGSPELEDHDTFVTSAAARIRSRDRSQPAPASDSFSMPLSERS